MFGALFNSYFVPLNVAFDGEILHSMTFLILNSIIDFIFFLDIIVSFRTVFIDQKGNECGVGKLMAINYLKTTFVIDVVATVPFDTILSISKMYRIYKDEARRLGQVPWIDLLGIFKLGRLLRLNDIIQYMKTTDDVKSSLRLSKLILFLFVYIHLFACNWWFMVKTNKDWIPAMDMTGDNYYRIYSKSITTQYLISLQLSVLTMTGNDGFPRSFMEILVMSIGLMIGAVINANIFGELALIMQGMNQRTTRFDLKMTRANTVMINLKLPFELQQSIRHGLTTMDPSLQTQ